MSASPLCDVDVQDALTLTSEGSALRERRVIDHLMSEMRAVLQSAEPFRKAVVRVPADYRELYASVAARLGFVVIERGEDPTWLSYDVQRAEPVASSASSVKHPPGGFGGPDNGRTSADDTASRFASGGGSRVPDDACATSSVERLSKGFPLDVWRPSGGFRGPDKGPPSADDLSRCPNAPKAGFHKSHVHVFDGVTRTTTCLVSGPEGVSTSSTIDRGGLGSGDVSTPFTFGHGGLGSDSAPSSLGDQGSASSPFSFGHKGPSAPSSLGSGRGDSTVAQTGNLDDVPFEIKRAAEHKKQLAECPNLPANASMTQHVHTTKLDGSVACVFLTASGWGRASVVR